MNGLHLFSFVPLAVYAHFIILPGISFVFSGWSDSSHLTLSLAILYIPLDALIRLFYEVKEPSTSEEVVSVEVVLALPTLNPVSPYRAHLPLN